MTLNADEFRDSLMHYGVKGMKWGVRRDADAKAERKRQRKETGEVLDRRFKRDFGIDVVSVEDYKKLSTKSVSVRKGATLKRVVSGRNRDAADRYVSTNKQDAANYRYALGQRFLGIGKRYEVTLKATNRLTSPSEKERVDAFVGLMDSPSIKLKNGKNITGREYLKRMGYGKDTKQLDTQRLGLKYYNDFLTNQWTDTPINSAYFNSIAKKGYNALIDDNDRNILAKKPLILLNPQGDVLRMNIKPLTPEEVKKAAADFRAPT